MKLTHLFVRCCFVRIFPAYALVLGAANLFPLHLSAAGPIPPPDGMIANWRGEGNANDSIGSNNGTLVNNVTYVPGMVGQAFNLDGNHSYITVPNAAALNLTNEITLELWYKDTGTPLPSYTLICKRDTTKSQRLATFGVSVDLGNNVVEPFIYSTTGFSQYSPYTPAPAPGVFHHLAASFRQRPNNGVEIKTYADGLLLRSAVVGGTLSNTLTTAPVLIGAGTTTNEIFKGIIDEVALYKRVLSPAEIQAIYLAGSAGKALTSTAPFIYTQPVDVSPIIGDTTNLAIGVGGSQPISYQWTLNGTNVPGATAYSLSFPNVQLTNAGSYSVIISNAYGSVTSAVAVVNVPVVDQSQTGAAMRLYLSQNNVRYKLAQTFTPAVSGRLFRFTTGGNTIYQGYPLIITITDTVNGLPGTNVLGQGLITDLDSSLESPALFTNTPVYLTAGVLYAAVLSSDAPASFQGSYSMHVNWGESYSRGALWQLTLPDGAWQPPPNPAMPPNPYAGTPLDIFFETYMTAGIPAVRLDSPANDTQWQTSDAIPLTATLGDTNTPVSDVAFYNGTNLIADVTQPPYALLWTNPPAGPAALSAVANLNSGLATSSVVNITVASVRPPNDLFANRSVLTNDYYTILVTNAGGSVETSEPRPYPFSTGQSVWWSWTAPRTAWVTLAITDSSATNAVMGVYNGNSVSSLIPVTSGLGNLLFLATSNQTYQIALDSLNGSLNGSPLVLAESDVEVTSPAAGTLYTAPFTLSVSAARTSTNRTLAHVDFYQDTNFLGSVSSPPYAYSGNCVASGTLALSVKAWDTAGISTISQPVSITVRPQNDKFANAITISGYATNIQTSDAGGTVESGEPHWGDNQGGHSIWYRWIAPADGVCTVTGTGVGSGLMLGVYVGNSVSNLSMVAVNALGSPKNPVVFQAHAGQTYNISVDGFLGEQGPLSWSLSLNPENDSFPNRAQILGNQFLSLATLQNATLDSGEANYISQPGAGSVWWTWTAPNSTLTTISVSPSDIPVEILVFTGTSVSALQAVTNSGSTWSTNASVTFQAQQGTTYQIAVAGSPSTASSFTLRLTSQSLHLINPPDIAAFPAPATIALSAIQDGTQPSQVDFYANDQLIGSATQSPYALAWSNVLAGTYTLQARSLAGDGTTNFSLPASVVVYTNGDLPSPHVFAGTYANRSFVVNAAGAVYIMGVDQTYQINTNSGVSVVASFYPRLVNWNLDNSARWQIINNGWGLTSDGRLYREGVTNVPAPAGVNRFVNLTENGWAFGDDGKIYNSGVTPFGFEDTTLVWKDGGPGYWSPTTLAANGKAYNLSGDSNGKYVAGLIPFPAGVTNWTKVAIGETWALLMGSDGNLYQTTSNPPALIPLPTGVTNWSAFTVGGFHAMAIGSDGQLYTWGRNWEGELGIGFAGDDQPPTRQVPLPPGVTAWTDIAAGNMHSLAIGNDGALYAWGGNATGPLGIGPLPEQQSPVRVTGVGSLVGIPAISTSGQTFRQDDGSFRLHFKTDLNRVYHIQYTDDLQNWKNANSVILGTGGYVDWIDNGPPNTDTLPSQSSMRAYRVAFGY